MHTQPTLLSPRNDVVFKLLFTREPELLRSMLGAVLSRQVDRAIVLNPDLPGDLSGDKNIVLDVRVSLADGTRVDVEMQVRVTPELRSRLVYYAARDYAQQLSRGQHFQALTPTVLIVWLDQPLWLTSRKLHRVFELRERQSGELFCDQLAIHVLQLRDWCVPAEGHASGDETALRRWARFLSAETAEELSLLVKEDPIMAQATHSLECISQDPEAARLAREREDSVKFYQLGLAMSLQQGIAEGLQQGIAEGLQQGIAEGLQQGLSAGEQQGIAQSIRQVCQALEIPIGPEREARLVGTAPELRDLLAYVLRERRWPDA